MATPTPSVASTPADAVTVHDEQTPLLNAAAHVGATARKRFYRARPLWYVLVLIWLVGRIEWLKRQTGSSRLPSLRLSCEA